MKLFYGPLLNYIALLERQHTVSLVNTGVPNSSICRIELIMIFFASRYYYSSSVIKSDY